jgi:phosphotransferase system  glucose/maltose/N-acetylglucosamine-specific IIC component
MWKTRARAVAYDRKMLIRSIVLNGVQLLLAVAIGVTHSRGQTSVDIWDIALLAVALSATLNLIKSVRALRRGPEKPKIPSK